MFLFAVESTGVLVVEGEDGEATQTDDFHAVGVVLACGGGGVDVDHPPVLASHDVGALDVV